MVVRLEELLVESVVEGEEFNLRVEAINVQIKKYSTQNPNLKESGIFEDPLTGSLVTFPIHRAKTQGDRVSVAVTSFDMNPFFGSRYADTKMIFAIITPIAFSVNYRDDEGTILDTKYL